MVPSLLPDLKVVDCTTAKHLHRALQVAWKQECCEQVNQALSRDNEAMHADSRGRVQQSYEEIRSSNQYYPTILAAIGNIYRNSDFGE